LAQQGVLEFANAAGYPDEAALAFSITICVRSTTSGRRCIFYHPAKRIVGVEEKNLAAPMTIVPCKKKVHTGLEE